MFHRLRSSSTGSEAGFTLVELLVVMLILGLLAGIGIPAFLSQREKARDVDAKNAAGAAALAAETIGTENNGEYDTVTPAGLRRVEGSLNKVDLSVLAAAPDSYTIRVTAVGGHTFDYTREPNGTIRTVCAPPGEGGCPEDGEWD